LADEQGLGKTVQALAALEADGAYPAVVVCPASMKLTWEREAARWLPNRRSAVLSGRSRRGFEQAAAAQADITILNYEIVDAPVPGAGGARAPALAPARALLRPPREGRGASAASAQAAGHDPRRPRQRIRVPPRRAQRDRVAARAAARPAHARDQGRRRSAQ